MLEDDAISYPPLTSAEEAILLEEDLLGDDAPPRHSPTEVVSEGDELLVASATRTLALQQKDGTPVATRVSTPDSVIKPMLCLSSGADPGPPIPGILESVKLPSPHSPSGAYGRKLVTGKLAMA